MEDESQCHSTRSIWPGHAPPNDRVADEYAEHIVGELAGKPLDRALLACFTEMVDEIGTIADIGCGPGHVAEYLHALGAPVIGIDLSPEMVAVARKRSPDIPFEVGSMLALDAPAAAWGGIVAFYSIIHLPPDSRSQALVEFYRALCSGGLLLAFHNGDEHGDERRHLDEWWGREVSLDVWFLDPREIEAMLRAAGFTIEMSLVRQPYAPDAEHQSQRAYILARNAAF